VPVVPGTPGVPGEAESPDEVIAGLRATCEGLRTANARLRGLLTAVTETGSKLDVIWAKQAIDVLLKLKDAAAAARDAGHARIDPALLAGQERYFTDAAQTGIVLNAARRSSLEKNGMPWRTGCGTGSATTSGSPMTCGFPSTTTLRNRPSG
jgi:hypothetical protein